MPRDVSLGPAVDPSTREMLYTSPSALSKFNPEEEGGCPARWWLRYVAGVKEPQTASQAEGIKGHAQIEHFTSTGEDVLGPVARAGKHLIHPPEPGAAIVEAPLQQLTADDLKVVGYIDRINPSGRYVSSEGQLVDEPGVPEVIDYKFTSDLKWAKQDGQLRTTQMVAYGVEMALRYPGIDRVRLSHVYFQKRGKKVALKSTLLVTVASTFELWHKVGVSVVQRMREVAKTQQFEDVPKNTNACSQFGGCPHTSKCFKDPLESFFISKGETMSLKDKLKAAKSNGVEAPPSGGFFARMAEANKLYRLPNGSTAMFINSIGGKFSFIPVDANGAPNAAPTALDPETPIAPAVAMVVVPPPPAPAAAASSVPPPPAPAFGSIEIGKCGVGTEYVIDQQGTVAEFTGPSRDLGFFLVGGERMVKLPLTSKVDAKPPPAPPVAEVTEKKPRKMQVKDETKATVPLATVSTARPADGINLFIGCTPNKPHVWLDGYIAALAEGLAVKFDVVDIRMPPDRDHELGFNKWKGALADAARKNPPPPGNYAIGSYGGDLANEVVSALVPLCALVVR